MKLPFLFLGVDIYDYFNKANVTLSNTQKQIFLINFLYMNEISKRILQYMEYKNLKPMEFMLSIGYKSDGNYSRMKQGNPPTEDTIKAILRTYPVSQSWLETGEGEMEEKEIAAEPAEYYGVKELYDDEKQELARLRAENVRLIDEVRFLRDLLLKLGK